MRRRFLIIIWLSIVLLLLVSCGSYGDQPSPTEIPVSEIVTDDESAAEISALSTVEESTETPFPTNSPTPKPTEPATATPSPVPTITVTQTPVPTNTIEPTVEPTATSMPEPGLVVEISSINIRSGPGTVYDIVYVAEEGEEFAVIGSAYDCQWLKILDLEGVAGWLSGNPDNVTLNQSCDGIPEAEIPPAPTAAKTPVPVDTAPPVLSGMGTITFINELPDRGASLTLRNCCERIQLSAHPGETIVQQIPADEYQWNVTSESHSRDLPQLFLTDGMQVIARLSPVENSSALYFEYSFLDG